MLELDSPGSVSTLMDISYLAGAFPGRTQIGNDARRNHVLRMSVNLTPVPKPSSVPRWLAAEFVWAIYTG